MEDEQYDTPMQRLNMLVDVGTKTLRLEDIPE